MADGTVRTPNDKSGWYRINANLLSGRSHPFKGDNAIGLGKERVIPAHAHILTGMYLCPKLSYQYMACQNLLSAETLHTTPLTDTVTAVS